VRFEPAQQPEERIDRFARRIYGTEKGGTVEGVLAANPGLADAVRAHPNLAIDGDTSVAVPDVETRPATPHVRPWGEL